MKKHFLSLHSQIGRSMCRTILLLTITLITQFNPADAQITRGFDQGISAEANNAEIVRQNDLWVMQVEYKSPRMVWAEVLDPKTSALVREEVWYVAWRAAVRPVTGRQDNDTLPVNEADPLPGPNQFVPQFTLVTYDDPKTEIPNQIITDSILPNALKQIQKIELRDGDSHQYKDTVSVIQPVPEPAAADAEEQNWIYGVATWRGVDRETDFFKIIFQGFSNAYEVRGEGETAQVWRKVFVQKASRPGDRFDPNQREFNYAGSPTWIYQPDSTKPVGRTATAEVQAE